MAIKQINVNQCEIKNIRRPAIRPTAWQRMARWLKSRIYRR